MVSTLEQMQVPNGTGPGVRRSKRPLYVLNDSYEDRNFMTAYTDGSESDNYVYASAVFPVDILKVNLAVQCTHFDFYGRGSCLEACCTIHSTSSFSQNSCLL